jgi:hypothetical protein
MLTLRLALRTTSFCGGVDSLHGSGSFNGVISNTCKHRVGFLSSKLPHFETHAKDVARYLATGFHVFQQTGRHDGKVHSLC